MFDTILEFAYYAYNHDYSSLLAKLQVKASAHALKFHRDQANEVEMARDMQLMQLKNNPQENKVRNSKPNKSGGRATEKVFVLSGNIPNKNHKCSLCGKMDI